MTIPVQGAKWTDIIGAGIVCRNIWYSSTSDFYDSVASSNMKNSQIIRMVMMSTKIGSPARFMVDVGKMEAMRVSHDEVCKTLLLMV